MASNREVKNDADKATAPSGKTSKTLWVNTTNFAEGLPYTIVRILSTLYFTDIGVKERYLGYLNFLGIPWNLKFLWSPFLDMVSTKRRWLVVLQMMFGLLLLVVAATTYFVYVPPTHQSFEQFLAGSFELPPTFQYLPSLLIFISVTFVALAFIAATNDIAIDGYYLEGLPDPRDQAAYSGYRVMAYRISMIFARSGLVAVVAYTAYRLERSGNANISQAWTVGFTAAALTMILISIFHATKIPEYEQPRGNYQAAEITRSFGRAFSTYLQQERVALVLIFIITYKIGDEILFSMNTPFLKRELHITNAQIAWLAGIVGAFGAVLGSMLGAWWIKRQGLRRAIWPLTILMNFNIWAYTWLAWKKPDPTTLSGISTIAFVYGYEQVAAGLGAAALTIFLMRTCKPEFKAAHYAVGSAIMSIPSTFIGGFGGTIVEHVGYLKLFVIAFFASIPSMLLLLVVPIKGDPPKENKS